MTIIHYKYFCFTFKAKHNGGQVELSLSSLAWEIGNNIWCGTKKIIISSLNLLICDVTEDIQFKSLKLI